MDIRRFIVASLDGFATRIVTDVRDALPSAANDSSASAPAAQPRVWPWAASLATLAAVAIVLGVGWARAREDLAKSRAEVAALAANNSQLQHTNEQFDALTKQVETLAGSVASLAPPSTAGAVPAARIEPVPYGEIPFDRSRLDALRDYLSKLEAQGFHGTVKATSATGVFCLTGNATDGFVPASASVLVSKCDLLGNPFEEALTSQQRQSLTFANLVAGVRQRSAGAITVVIDNAPSTRLAAQYPPRTESVTAGEWNRVAAANNRVEFSAEAVP